MIPSALDFYNRYVAHGDPLARAGNVVAAFILSNQPFYPLYLYFLVGGKFWPSLLTLLTSPFFAAVPFVMRKNAFAGKWLLIFASLGNTLLATKALGPASGLELFFFPCLVLGALMFGAREQYAAWAAALLPIALFLSLRGRYGAPFVQFDEAEYTTLFTLHAVSAAAIAAVICFTISASLRARPG